MATPHRRRPHRLPSDAYVGTVAAHLTFVTGERRPLFEDATNVKATLLCLEQARAKHEATVHAYCFMPDHRIY